MPTIDQILAERRQPKPPANPLQGVAAALGRVAGALQKVGQTLAREAGKFAAWTEQQQGELFSGKVTPTTVIGTAASFILPTTIMQVIGGQKKADLKNPEKTAEAFAYGWFHSGDVGEYDEDLYIYVADRKKDMIKTGGENVSSREVEEVLYKHSAVKEVAVIGLPDPKWIEKVTAVVVLREGYQPSEELKRDIIEFAKANLAHFKAPKEVIFVDSLPKSPSGKILKRELREMFRSRGEMKKVM
jgi:hypothetical protein